MTKKELSQLYYLKKEIKEQQRRLFELEVAATNCAATVTGLPAAKGMSDKVGNYATQIADLKALLEQSLKKCLNELNRLNEYIQNVDDPLVKQIMIYRFIEGNSWVKVAFLIGGNNTVDRVKKRVYRYLKNN